MINYYYFLVLHIIKYVNLHIVYDIHLVYK